MRLCRYLMLLPHLAVLVTAESHSFSGIAMNHTKLEGSTTLSLRRIQCGSVSVNKGVFIASCYS